MYRVLVTATHYSRLCADAKKLLEDNGCEVIENKTEIPVLPFCELEKIMTDIDAVVAGIDDWNEDIFKISKRLKVIARFGVGVDNIDLDKAREYRIKVINAKGANSNAVAEMTIAFILGALRNILLLDKLVRKGKWERFVGREIAGKTVGLLGFGAIAQSVAKKLKGFDVNILAYDKYPNMVKACELGVKMVSFGEVIKNSDVVSLHMPSCKETYHIMNNEKFTAMKDGAYFINTARGAMVDEKALYSALKRGKLTAAAVDVYEQEPVKPDNPLLELDNIVCTPHQSGETFEAYYAISMSTANGIIDVLNGRIPENLLNS